MEAVKDIDSQTVKMHCYSVSKYIWFFKKNLFIYGILKKSAPKEDYKFVYLTYKLAQSKNKMQNS